MTPIELVREWLLSDVDLAAHVGDRIRGTYTPGEAGQTALLLAGGADRPGYNGGGRSGLRNVTVTVYVMADSTDDYPDMDAARAAAAAVITTVHRILDRHYVATSGERICVAQVVAHTDGVPDGTGVARRVITLALQVAG